jgi:heptosyltransferase-1
MAHRFALESLTAESEARILLVRLSAIGDVLMTSPVPQALREAFPRAHIAWLVEPLSAPFVRVNPYVDEVIVLEQLGRWRRLLSEWKLIPLLREIRAYGRELRARQFDIAIDCQGLLKSGVLTGLSGASRRIGFIPPREYNHLFLTDRVERPPHPTRITQPYLTLLTALGLPVTPRRPVLPVPAGERAEAQAFLAAHGLVGQPYAACCISTSRPQKDWVWPRWRQLAELLRDRVGLRTVFIGGSERRVDTLQLIEACPAEPVSAVGRTSLLQSAALVQDAALVVGGDTGLTYAGLATDTPTVALYGSTDPSWLAEEFCVAVCYHPQPCSPCHRRPKCANYDCMQAITPDEVLDAAIRLTPMSQVKV